ncbi:hypothetical protein JXM83_02405 [Candidatus Woesearchaeota archaeon]|nr:hypothetical protein [Candidatus Woesearchaeota archaeon]
MKQIVLTFFLLVIFANFAFAVNDCPSGYDEGECIRPCGLYTDQDSNYICDHSQDELYLKPVLTTESVQEIELTGQEVKSMTVEEVAKVYSIDVNQYIQELEEYIKKPVSKDSSFQLMHDNYGMEPSIAKDIAISLQTNNIQYEISAPKETSKYKFLTISIITIIAYVITFTLQKTKKIQTLLHKRIWNVVLLITFVVSGILGLLLVIRINYGWALTLPFNMLYWHVEAGTVMAWITIFHIFEHLNFYKYIFIKKKTNERRKT